MDEQTLIRLEALRLAIGNPCRMPPDSTEGDADAIVADAKKFEAFLNATA